MRPEISCSGTQSLFDVYFKYTLKTNFNPLSPCVCDKHTAVVKRFVFVAEYYFALHFSLRSAFCCHHVYLVGGLKFFFFGVVLSDFFTQTKNPSCVLHLPFVCTCLLSKSPVTNARQHHNSAHGNPQQIFQHFAARSELVRRFVSTVSSVFLLTHENGAKNAKNTENTKNGKNIFEFFSPQRQNHFNSLFRLFKDFHQVFRAKTGLSSIVTTIPAQTQHFYCDFRHFWPIFATFSGPQIPPPQAPHHNIQSTHGSPRQHHTQTSFPGKLTHLAHHRKTRDRRVIPEHF